MILECVSELFKLLLLRLLSMTKRKKLCNTRRAVEWDESLLVCNVLRRSLDHNYVNSQNIQHKKSSRGEMMCAWTVKHVALLTWIASIASAIFFASLRNKVLGKYLIKLYSILVWIVMFSNFKASPSFHDRKSQAESSKTSVKQNFIIEIKVQEELILLTF